MFRILGLYLLFGVLVLLIEGAGAETIVKCITYLNAPRYARPLPFSFFCNNNEVLSVTSVTARRQLIQNNLDDASYCQTIQEDPQDCGGKHVSFTHMFRRACNARVMCQLLNHVYYREFTRGLVGCEAATPAPGIKIPSYLTVSYTCSSTMFEAGTSNAVPQIELSPFAAKSVTGKTVNIRYDGYPATTFASSDSYCDVTTSSSSANITMTVRELDSSDFQPAGTDSCPIRLVFSGNLVGDECSGAHRDLTGLPATASGSFRIQLFRNTYLSGYRLYYWISIESTNPVSVVCVTNAHYTTIPPLPTFLTTTIIIRTPPITTRYPPSPTTTAAATTTSTTTTTTTPKPTTTTTTTTSTTTTTTPKPTTTTTTTTPKPTTPKPTTPEPTTPKPTTPKPTTPKPTTTSTTTTTTTTPKPTTTTATTTTTTTVPPTTKTTRTTPHPTTPSTVKSTPKPKTTTTETTSTTTQISSTKETTPKIKTTTEAVDPVVPSATTTPDKAVSPPMEASATDGEETNIFVIAGAIGAVVLCILPITVCAIVFLISFRKKRKRREKYMDSDGESYLTNSSKSRKPDDRRDNRRDRERRRDHRDIRRGRDRDRDRRSTEHLERPRDRPVRMNDYYQSDPEYRSTRPRPPREDGRPPRRGDYEERRRREDYNERDRRRRDYEERPRPGEYEVPRRRNEDTRLDGSNEYLTARNVPIRRRYNEELPPPPEEEDAHYERLSIVADPVPPDLIMDSQNAGSRLNNDGPITGVYDFRGYEGSTQPQEQGERRDQNNPQYDKNNPPKPTPRRMIRQRGDGIPGRLSSKRRHGRGTNPDGSTRRKPRQSMRSMASSVYSYDDEGDDWGDDWDDDDDDDDGDSEDGYDRLADFIEEEEDAIEAVNEPNYVNTEPDYANSQVQSAMAEPDYENQKELQEGLQSSQPDTTTSLGDDSQLEISDNSLEENLEEKLSRQLSEFKGSRSRTHNDSSLNV